MGHRHDPWLANLCSAVNGAFMLLSFLSSLFAMKDGEAPLKWSNQRVGAGEEPCISGSAAIQP
mgnify:CR=1 FL=1